MKTRIAHIHTPAHICVTILISREREKKQSASAKINLLSGSKNIKKDRKSEK